MKHTFPRTFWRKTYIHVASFLFSEFEIITQKMYQDVRLLTSLVGRLLNSHHSLLKADHQLAGVHPTQQITRITRTLE